MSLCLMNVHGDIEGDYEFVCDIPNGTNGEVIQALFPYFKTNEKWKATVHFYYDTDITEITACATREWWDAPYWKDGE